MANSLVSVLDFIEIAKKTLYREELKGGRGRAFEVYMKNKNLYYMYSSRDFQPYFEEFINQRQ